MFDPAGGRYVLYGRTKYALPEVAAAVADKPWLNFWGRSVIRAESKDFLHWKETKPDSGKLVLTPDTRDPVGSEIYSMMVFPYEGVYIGLVQMFHKERDTCRLEIQLAISRDTVHFTRVGDRAAFIPVGPEGSWDRFNNSIATNPPLPVGDTLRFYYGGRSYRHSPYNGPAFPYHGKDRGESRGAIGLATIPRDRFVSMRRRGRRPNRHPAAATGRRATPPQRQRRRRLDPRGSARPGWPASSPEASASTATSLDIPVTWEQGSLAQASIGPVTLRITLQNARCLPCGAGRVQPTPPTDSSAGVVATSPTPPTQPRGALIPSSPIRNPHPHTSSGITYGLRYVRLKMASASGLSLTCSVFGSMTSFWRPAGS